jgi:sortase B
MKKVLYIIITIALIGTMLISAISIFNNLTEDRKQEKVYNELSQYISGENQQENNEKQQLEDYSKVFKLNTDMVAWLKIEGTNINYPVMQTPQNPDYYINKNFYKQDSSWGTPYMEEECDINSSSNLIIYGHHINKHRMFGELENYKDKKYYNNHKVIKLITERDVREYEIVTVFKTTVYEENEFKYYEFINYKIQQQLDDFINQCESKAFYNTGVKCTGGDKLITLSTCEYSSKNGRLVVVAKEIKR